MVAERAGTGSFARTSGVVVVSSTIRNSRTYASYIGRVGALALFLGVGGALTSTAVAWADDADSTPAGASHSLTSASKSDGASPKRQKVGSPRPKSTPESAADSDTSPPHADAPRPSRSAVVKVRHDPAPSRSVPHDDSSDKTAPTTATTSLAADVDAPATPHPSPDPTPPPESPLTLALAAKTRKQSEQDSPAPKAAVTVVSSATVETAAATTGLPADLERTVLVTGLDQPLDFQIGRAHV